MFYIKSKNYVKGFILISLLILFSIYLSILNPIEDYDSDRIYNLAHVHEIYRVSLVKKFLDKQYVKNSILILGDSQPNGFLYPTKDVFSTHLSKKLNKKVINLAFLDASIKDNLYILEYLKEKNMQFGTIIFNINPAHPKTPEHFKLDLEHSVDYKVGILKHSNIFKNFSNQFNPITTPKDSFHKTPHLINYFNMPDDTLKIYLSRIKKLIMHAKLISEQVIIYSSPHCLEECKRLKLDIVAQKKLEDNILNICKENNVTFLKPDITDKKYFIDVVHFNTKGHVQMADILYQMIKK